MSKLRAMVEEAFERRGDLDVDGGDAPVRDAVEEVMEGLDSGRLRVAEKREQEWFVNEWLKKAVLLSFTFRETDVIAGGFTNYFDKVPMKYTHFDAEDFRREGARIVPPACVRRGAYIGRDVILMPSYVNVGAYVDDGTMVDTWATVGSCAQIGKNVHLSGGTGIGGVLEPLQASPTIIEDNCFIGARSEIVEGVVVETGSVVSMGVYIGQSTRIYNRQTREISYGRIPSGSVVVSGSLPSPEGSYSLYCAIIVKQVDEKTRGKVGINELLRTL